MIFYDYWPEKEIQSKMLTCIISEVDDYNIIIEDYDENLYELSWEICIQDAILNLNAFYFDKSVDVNSINTKNIREKGILIKDADRTRKDNEKNVREDPKSWNYVTPGKYIWYNWAPLYTESLYKIGYEPEYGKVPIISLLSTKTIRMTWLPDYPWLSKDSRFYTRYYFQYWLFFSAWLMTIIIETIILFIISKSFWKERQISNKRLILIWILASTVTLPLLWFVLPLFIGNYVVYTIVWESFVAMIETVILKYWLKISRWKAVLASIVCNAASYLAWLLIF